MLFAADTIAEIKLSAFTVMILLSLAVPIVNGILLKYAVPTTIKVLVTVVLSAVQGLISGNMTDDGGSLVSKEVFVLWIVGLVISIATYLGVYSKVGITNRPGGALGANVGIGPATPGD